MCELIIVYYVQAIFYRVCKIYDVRLFDLFNQEFAIDNVYEQSKKIQKE